MLDIALKTAENFKVFPVRENQKKPCINKWQLEASSDPVQIKKWWRKWPKANIGLLPAPTCFIFDFDVRPGVGDSIQKLSALGLDMLTYAVRTPSGGRHLYYQHPGRVVKAKDEQWKRRFPGVDIRADSAYVLAPGSFAGARTYKEIRNSPFAELPENIKRILPYKETTNPLTETDLLAAPGNEYETLPEIIPNGERDSYLWGFVCSLVARRKPKTQILDEAKKVFNLCEQPAGAPFLWITVEAMIERAINEYGAVPLSAAAQADPDKLPDVLQKALKKYVLISDGNLVADTEAHPGSAILSLHHWQNVNKNVWLPKIDKPLSKIWLSHAQRQTVFGATYVPKRERLVKKYGATYYNIYVPSDIVPQEGSNIGTVLEHVKYLLEGNTADIKHFLYWLAFTVRYPEKRIPWAPIMVSSYQGVGKGWLYQLFKKLLGAGNCHRIDPVDLTEQKINFNEWWGGTLLCIDEIDPKYNFVEKLKPIITETSGVINNKYGKKEQRDIYCNVIAFTNHTNALKIDENDRRWWVIHTKVRPLGFSYYDRLFEWLDTDGPSHFLYWLQQLDLSKFKHAAPPPVTRAKQQMIRDSRSEVETCILDAYEMKNGPFAFDIVSTNIVAVFVYNQLALEKPGGGTKRQIAALLNKLCNASLSQDRYRVVFGESRKQVRLVLIRNPDKWVNAQPDSVVNHYLSAMKAAI